MRILLAAGASCAALGVGATGAAAAPAGTTLIVGGDTTLMAPLTTATASAMASPPSPLAASASISADGRYVAFVTNLTDFGVSNGLSQAVAVRDMLTGALAYVTPVSDLASGVFRVVTRYESPSISADGRRVVFVVHPSVGAAQIWMRDLVTNTTYLVSATSAGAPGDGGSSYPSISADGRRVAFSSVADDLVAGDLNNDEDVFVRDLDPADPAHGTTTLVSVGADPAIHDGAMPAISADGDHVAFVSALANIVPGASGLAPQVYVRDLRPGHEGLRLASVVDGGTAEGDDGSIRPSVSRDGARVAFETGATNLGPLGAQVAGFEVWVHDFSGAGSTFLASRADGPDGAPGDGMFAGEAPAISADGTTVAFEGIDTNLGDAGGFFQVYARDLGAGRTRLVSRASGINGAVAGVATTEPLMGSDVGVIGGVTAGGGCVAFNAGGDLLGASAVVDNVFVRVLADGCGQFGTVSSGGDQSGGDQGGGDQGGGGDRGDGGPAPDVRPPRLRVLSLSRARAGAGHRTRIVLRLTSSEAGRLTITIMPAVRGKRRWSVVLTRRVGAGQNRFVLDLRHGRAPLPRGRYRIALIARDGAGNAAKPVVRTLTIPRG